MQVLFEELLKAAVDRSEEVELLEGMRMIVTRPHLTMTLTAYNAVLLYFAKRTRELFQQLHAATVTKIRAIIDSTNTSTLTGSKVDDNSSNNRMDELVLAKATKKAFANPKLRKLLEQVHQWHNQMREAKIRPDVHTYNALIHMYAAIGDADSALELFETMKGDFDVSPSSSTMATLIYEHTKHRMLPAAFQYVRQAEELRLVDPLVCRAVMELCQVTGSRRELWYWFLRAVELQSSTSTTYPEEFLAVDVTKEFVASVPTTTTTARTGSQHPSLIHFHYMLSRCQALAEFQAVMALLQQHTSISAWPFSLHLCLMRCYARWGLRKKLREHLDQVEGTPMAPQASVRESLVTEARLRHSWSRHRTQWRKQMRQKFQGTATAKTATAATVQGHAEVEGDAASFDGNKEGRDSHRRAREEEGEELLFWRQEMERFERRQRQQFLNKMHQELQQQQLENIVKQQDQTQQPQQQQHRTPIT